MNKFCPKHPRQKMTLLFTSWVCDICEPPKHQVEPEKKKVKIDYSTSSDKNIFLTDPDFDLIDTEDDQGFHFFIMSPDDYQDGTD